MRIGILVSLCCILVTEESTGQSVKPDTAFLTSARTHQLALYNRYIFGQSRLYNGSEYRDFFSKNDEHPFFGVDDWAFGDILYDDEYYKDIPLFYDIYHDKVITEHILNGSKLELISEKVARFSFAGHNFVRLQEDEAKAISTGFYDLLYDGDTKVYCRREKLLRRKVESHDILETFDERNRIFILKSGIYYPVRKKRSVLDVLEDKKSELKSYMKDNTIAFKADREKAIVQLAKHYDSQNIK
jgi:hypothetical protein